MKNLFKIFLVFTLVISANDLPSIAMNWSESIDNSISNSANDDYFIPTLRNISDGTNITNGNQILTGTWSKTQYYNKYNGTKSFIGDSATRNYSTWVTLAPELYDELHGQIFTDTAAISSKFSHLLGMPTGNTNNILIEYWTDKNTLVKPTLYPYVNFDGKKNDGNLLGHSDLDIQTLLGETLNYDFVKSHKADFKKGGIYYTKIYDKILAQKPANWSANDVEAYTNFLTGQLTWAWGSDVKTKGAPWSALGYTYDWSGTNSVSEINGLSEYVIRSVAYDANKKETISPYVISGLYSMASYPYKVANVVEEAIKTADPTYTLKFLASNGDFNFTPTSAASIDTIYAGRDFQPTGTSIKIGSNGTITGGQGILVSSLGYKIENQGNISGETQAKMSFGGIGGLENSQNIGVIFLGKSIAANDAEWAIIDANQGITGVPSSSDRNKNIFVNNGSVSAPKIGIYANGDTEIINTGSIGTQSFITDAAIYFTGTKASLDNDGIILGHIISEANNTIIDGLGDYDESDIIIKKGTYNITFGRGSFGSDTSASSILTANGVSGSIKVEEGSEVYLKDTNLTGTGSGDGIEVVGKTGGAPLSYETKLTLVDKTVFNGFENDIKLSTPIVTNQNAAALYLKNSDNATPGNDIIFNDHIYSDSADHNILINTNQGNSVILNNTITGNGVGIYLQSGTLKLGKDGNVLATGENYFGQTPASLFQTEGTLLDLQNNVKDTLIIKDWGIPSPASDDNADLAIDVSLANSAWIDTITSNNMFDNAKLELSKINLLTESDTAKTLELYKGTNFVLNKPTLEANSALYTNNYKYTITDAGSTSDDVLELTFAPDSTNGGLEKAINDPAKNISYALLENTSISSDLTAPTKETHFTLYGNGKTIDGNGNAGFNLTSGTGKSTLTIQDVTLQNFNPQNIGGSWTGSVVYTDGDSVHIENSTLKNNIGSAAIVAADTTVTIGENVIFEGNETEYGYGSAVRLKSNANLSLAKGTIFRHNKTEDGGTIYVGDGSKIYAFDGVTFDSNASTNDNGGAINIFGDDATIGTVSNSVFNKNVAGNNGGAIYNANLNAELNFVDTSFIDNKSTGGNGGAIYTKGSVVNFTAENNNAVISGNSDSTGKNAITFGNDVQATASSLNLKAKDTNSVYFDGLVANNTSQNMNINIGDTPYQYYQGNVFFGDNFAVANNIPSTETNYNVNSGGVIFANDASLNGSNLTMATNTSLGLANNKASQINLNTLKLGTHTNLSIDIGSNTADKINATSVIVDAAYGSNVNIANINTKTMPSNLESTKIPLSSIITGVHADELTYSVDSVLSGKVSEDIIFRRMFTTDGTNLMISTPYGSDDYRSFNPSVLASPVAAQVGSYLTQINSYEQAFGNYDMLMALPKAVRQSMKYANKYASSQGTGQGGVITFSPNQIPEQDKGLWFRPFATFETVGLKNGPSVGNIGYGSLFGGDSPIIELKHGWDAVYSAYAGYNGSHQTYDGVGIYQNGGQLGASALFYKGNFFTGLTANVGANVGEANTSYGKENFTMLATGVASKTGYNFEFKEGRFIVQPNFLMSYTFVNTYDYTNAAGVSIQSDPLNAIQIAPGIKFIGNLKNGWQPYASVQMVWNIIDKTKFAANNVSLPEMSIKPYVQYGIGLQKRWGERFTAFGQAMIRNAGRNGIALQFGMRWALGKDSKK